VKSVKIFITEQTTNRLDKCLALIETELSRRKIRQIIDSGSVYVNGKRLRVASRHIQPGAKIEFDYDLNYLKSLQKKYYSLKDDEVLFWEEGILAINKPPGIPCQPTRLQSTFHMQKIVSEYIKKFGRKLSLIPIHRLDQETSGVLLFAYQPEMSSYLMSLFKERKVSKHYLAIVKGSPKDRSFKHTCQLSSIRRGTGKVDILKRGGRQAETYFKCLAKHHQISISLLECRPITGRSHQIRAQLACLQLPILGDKRYGEKIYLPSELKNLCTTHHMLHANSLSFHLQNGKKIIIQAHKPHNMTKICQQFFKNDG